METLPVTDQTTNQTLTNNNRSNKMKSNTSTSTSTLANGGLPINHEENSPRLISAKRVAQLKRTMDGAKRRKDRLKKELVVCRAIISRKYTDRLDEKGNVEGRNQLTSEQVFGFKLKRTQIEMDLAMSRRDYFVACKEYLSAVTVNLRSERMSLKAILHDNRIIIQSKKLLQVTVEILKKHGSNGGAIEVKQLTDLALSGDMKVFRNGFLETIKKFDPAHYVNISGVCTVETKIVHAMMDELVEFASKAEVAPNAEFSLDVVSQ
jgi:prolyl oligopeptidase PreP (S9A serine peptidase family)